MMEENISNRLLKTTELPSHLKGLLPNGYSYKLKKWVPHESQPSNFDATLFTNIYTDEEAKEWWQEFKNKSNTTMRVRATCRETGKVNMFKIYLRCIYQGRDKKAKPNPEDNTPPMRRHTYCPASMIIAIRRQVKFSRSKLREPVDPVHPCEIQLRFCHTHPTDEADTQQFRPVSKDIEDKLLELFHSGHSPLSAFETLKNDLQVEYGPSSSEVISDRHHYKAFCYRLYYKHFEKDYVNLAKEDLLGILNSKAMHYNAISGATCINVGVSGKDLAVAVCTPLMKRAHALQMSGDVVYIDSIDRTDYQIHILIAHTAVGGIPLGVILTTSKSSECLVHGFQLFKKLLPEHAFYGRGDVGPCALLVDDSESLRFALNATWVGSDVITCSFRILQTTWRWLCEEKLVLKDHQLHLLYLLKVFLFASNEVEMFSKYQALCTNTVAIHYPQYLQLVKSIWGKKHFWGHCFHQLLPLQGANNYYEGAIRALKDKVFEVTKTFNLVQLLNYVVTRIDVFYKTKVLDILNRKFLTVYRSHFNRDIPSRVINEIKLVAENCFLVPSEFSDGEIYTVDALLNVCSCSVGVVGSLCIHQFWVCLKMNFEIFKVSHFNDEFRQKLFLVATGGLQHTSHHPTQLPVVPSTPHGSVETEPVFKDAEVPVNNSDASSLNLQGSHDPVLMPPDNNYSQEFSNLSENRSQMDIKEESSSSFLGVRNEDYSSFTPAEKEAMALEASILEKRMDAILPKFDHFSDLVKNGLKSQPGDFLPALETMMKNLERKGYSSDILISGLSFFGVVSAQSLARNEDKCFSTPAQNGAITLELWKTSILEKRMDTALSKFEHFYDLVQNGLKRQPGGFLPALEITMKNLERKGYSSDVLVSGLSSFGMMSAKPVKQKKKKYPLIVIEPPVQQKVETEPLTDKDPEVVCSPDPIDDIEPKVHGRQMITYGRKRLTEHNADGIVSPTPLKTTCQNPQMEEPGVKLET